MKVYHITHPAHPKALMRLAVNVRGEVAKVYATGIGFIPLCMQVLAAHAGAPGTQPEYVLDDLRAAGCQVRQDRSKLPTNEKVALWCRLWKEYKGAKWSISGPDAKLLGALELDEELLRWYLDDATMPQTKQTWLWRGKQSIRNLNAYYNQVKVAMNAPAPSKHPGHWDRAHYMKLDGPGISEYIRHLNALGLVAKTDRAGRILDYVKAPQ